MGRYVPPDMEGVVSFNRASGKGHALGARASKLKSDGILTVRFECPFAIWCTNCDPEQIIGQGVRFNAEKKKVGNYYSTPIWSFRLKHTICGKWIEVRTDPKNAEYVVVEGGRRRDTGADKLLEGEILLGSTDTEKAEREKEGAFGSLEKKVEDKAIANSQQARIVELRKRSERDWSDPYEINKRIRKDFRAGRLQRQADERSGGALQEKFGLGLDLVASTSEDTDRAKLVDFGEQKEITMSGRAMFGIHSAAPSQTSERNTGKNGQKIDLAAETKSALHNTLRDNTRAGTDPFVPGASAWQPIARRRRDGEPQTTRPANCMEIGLSNGDAERPRSEGITLVAYDSD